MKTLIVEDSATLAAIYQAYLEGSGLDIYTAASFADASKALTTLKPELVLLDIELPDGNGLDLLELAGAMDPAPAVVVMTGHGVEFADASIERGAADFLAKPFDASRLRVTLTNAAEKFELSQRLRELSGARDRLGALIGSSAIMQAVYATIDSLASSNATAFITGESGTGKELAARAIHDQSARAPGNFVVIDCAAIPEDVIESELFGAVEGSQGRSASSEGLVRRAEAGTLLLDEVCALPFDVQSVLLRFLQDGSYRAVGSSELRTADVRIIAATNRDPLAEMRDGRLREDLFYRLHVVPLRMPPLRERGNDVLELADHFVAHFARAESRPVRGLAEKARRELKRYPWPGNVRELENTVHRLILMSHEAVISDDALRAAIGDSGHGHGLGPGARDGSTAAGPGSIDPLWLVEKRAILAAIDHCGGNINKAASFLEVAPSTIYRKLQAWKASGGL